MEFWKDLLLHAEGKLPYADGVKLYFHFNPNSTLIEFFKKEDRYSRKKIKECLDAKYVQFSANQKANDFKSFGISKYKGKINLEVLPADLRVEYSKLSQIIRKIAALHARLYNCSTDAQRYEIAKQIIDLVEERRLIFTRVDEYMASGSDPVKKEISPTLRARPDLPKNYQIEYELRRLRVNRTKWNPKKNPRRIHDYNAVCARIEFLIKNRYGSQESLPPGETI